MPFESYLSLVVTYLLGAVVAFFIWLRVQTRWLPTAGVGCFVADLLVETDREYLLALFPLRPGQGK